MKQIVFSIYLMGLCMGLTHPGYSKSMKAKSIKPSNTLEKTNLADDSLLKLIQASQGPTRDQAIVHAARIGHFPEFLRKLKPVYFTDGKNKITIYVTPDYFSVGKKNNYVRIATGMREATAIAKMLKASLPTPKMVDAIYRQADKRLEPRSYKPDATMVSSAKIFMHNDGIEQKLKSRDQGQLIAGHKKDLVISKKLLYRGDRLAIYGWHRQNFQPIQPLSFWHSADYVDYSHGIRLVSRKVFVNNKPADLADVLKNPELAPLLSYEGALDLDMLQEKNANKVISAAH